MGFCFGVLIIQEGGIVPQAAEQGHPCSAACGTNKTALLFYSCFEGFELFSLLAVLFADLIEVFA